MITGGRESNRGYIMVVTLEGLDTRVGFLNVPYTYGHVSWAGDEEFTLNRVESNVLNNVRVAFEGTLEIACLNSAEEYIYIRLVDDNEIFLNKF